MKQHRKFMKFVIKRYLKKIMAIDMWIPNQLKTYHSGKLVVLVSFIAKKRKLHISTHNNKKKLLGGSTDNQTVFVC